MATKGYGWCWFSAQTATSTFPFCEQKTISISLDNSQATKLPVRVEESQEPSQLALIFIYFAKQSVGSEELAFLIQLTAKVTRLSDVSSEVIPDPATIATVY